MTDYDDSKHDAEYLEWALKECKRKGGILEEPDAYFIAEKYLEFRKEVTNLVDLVEEMLYGSLPESLPGSTFPAAEKAVDTVRKMLPEEK